MEKGEIGNGVENWGALKYVGEIKRRQQLSEKQM